MTSAEWKAWLIFMRETRGWNITRCLRELGCGNNANLRWRNADPPYHIGLACAALVADLPPWKGVESARNV